MWALDRMLHGPGASASVILPRSQNQNRRDLFWNVEGVNRSSNLIVGSQPFWFEKSLPVKGKVMGDHCGGAIIDHEAPRERRFVVYYCSAVYRWSWVLGSSSRSRLI